MIEKVLEKLIFELAPYFTQREGFTITLKNAVPLEVYPYPVDLYLKHRETSFVNRGYGTSYMESFIGCLNSIKEQNILSLRNPDDLRVYQVAVQEHLDIALENTIKYAESLK
jgi:hypothetical protein